MIIIPARLHSSRLPNKLILPLDGIPIIIRVANIAKNIDSCVVACDDRLILDICKKHKIECILTYNFHQSGTDRCNEALESLKLNNDEVVINLQGDEPFIEEDVIKKLKDEMQNKIKLKDDVFMASCYKVITQNDAKDPNLVKVVINDKSFALYFSRSKIPYNRDDAAVEYFGHIGIYAFSALSLKQFCNLKKSNLENIEKLEQLRALSNNKNIFMVKVNSNSIGIDTKEDYDRALKLIEKHKER